jgi:gliding motility-associated-like protein
MKKSLLLIGFVLCALYPVLARHIIGGEITYKCLGNGDYEFTMRIYRDCGCTNCADFDNIAPISIFECGGDVPCSSLKQGQQKYKIQIRLLQRRFIDAPDYPCLIPPNVCVEEGLYRWKMSDFRISLPQSNNSYHITYQRCCRNITINNLLRPDDQGATFSAEITPAAQRLCNNSPVFKSFPPTVICANSPLSFDHAATDADGDQLVYEFCTPLQGGGPILGGVDYNSCLGAQPDPPCPPPYRGVNFIIPTYTTLEPMGGNPKVTINANTGLITGTPEIQGQFVVGVCVTEYRNGVALSRVSRDFQFNVASCNPTVVAKLKADTVLNNGELYVLRTCGEKKIQLTNESFQQRYINDHRWEFSIEGQTQVFNEWSPAITFPDLGTYTGRLLLNTSTQECSDTANVRVHIYPAVNADFDYAYDTCIAGPVEFADKSSVPGGRISEWSWIFGDGNSASVQNPRHQYKIPGSLPVQLRVRDINSCQDDQRKIISYFPVPRLIVVSPSAEDGCQPLTVKFQNLSFPIDESYKINWDFGDGQTGQAISPTHTYTMAGRFTVTIDITSPIGCKTDTIFPNLIIVEPSPIADFDYMPKALSTFQRTVNFLDQSKDVNRWNWTFANDGTSRERNPTYTFQDTGIQVIKLIVTHPSGCKDTIEQRIDVKPEVRYFLPNAFSPNEDSTNEEFVGAGLMEGAQNFQMTIWNRWGERIFESTDPTRGWNGRKFNQGEPSPDGVYVVLVTFTGPRGEPFSLQGFATLIR